MYRFLNKVLLVSCFLLARPAGASPVFPTELRDELSMACLPTCKVCHTTDPGEEGTASRPFAATLVGLGLEAKDEESLHDAIAALGTSDSDKDGDSDIAELTNDPPTDPNDPMATIAMPGVGMCDAEVNYGCGAHVAGFPSRSAPSPWVTTGLLLVALWAGRRVARRASH